MTSAASFVVHAWSGLTGTVLKPFVRFVWAVIRVHPTLRFHIARIRRKSLDAEARVFVGVFTFDLCVGLFTWIVIRVRGS
jgi:hypothetical protein